MAHPARGDAHDHVSRARVERRDLLDRERLVLFEAQRGLHGVPLGDRSASARAAYRVRSDLPRYLPAMARILLVRHGQSVWNADGRWQGQADPPLSDLGAEQAVERRLGAVGMVDAHLRVRPRAGPPHRRARRARGSGPTSVVDARLRERTRGSGRGAPAPRSTRGGPGSSSAAGGPPGYEPDDSVLARVLDRARRDRGARTTATCSS